MKLTIPQRLLTICSRTAERRAWLAQLPDVIHELAQRWLLELGQPFDGDEVSCSWVAPVRLPDGSTAILKLGMPHMEGRDELQSLRFWDGDPTVRLLQFDEGYNAMLLERCLPGTPLRTVPEPEQDAVIARLLRRLWRTPPEPHPFRPLAVMTAHWSAETLEAAAQWSDPGVVREGLRLFAELPESAPTQVLLATDLHAGNVLRAEREPWLVIDPKPFVGDPAYDATQHLFNCLERLSADPEGLIGRFGDLLGVDRERVRLWVFARAVAESHGEWQGDQMLALARRLAP